MAMIQKLCTFISHCYFQYDTTKNGSNSEVIP